MPQPFYSEEEEKKEEENTNDPEKIKIGEKEYTQDELSKLVGLGETAQEYQSKWNRSISDFYPDYTKKSQRLAELEKAEAEREVARQKQEEKEREERAAKGKLTPEEIKQMALKEAKELGIVTQDVFEEAVNRKVNQIISGNKLIEDAEAAIDEYKEKYGITTSVADVLKHMDEEGFKKPDKAIKDMFEEQIDKVKVQKLQGIKPEGMYTQEGGTAGGKQPPPRERITRDKLADAIRTSLTRSRGV